MPNHAFDDLFDQWGAALNVNPQLGKTVFHIESNGVDRTGTLTVPDTGGWQIWTTITTSVTLSAGQQVLRLVIDGESAAGVFGNVNWFELVPPASPSPESH